MKIKYLKSARDDIIWFRSYYRRSFPEGSVNVRERLRAAFQLLSNYPEAGILADGFIDAFEYPISKTPFTVIYRVQANELQILRLLDQRSEFSNTRKG